MTLKKPIALGFLMALFATGGFAQPYGSYETNLVPIANASISSNEPDSNFGGDTVLRVGLDASGAQLFRSFIRFDLTSIPTNAWVSNVIVTVVSSGPSPTAHDYYLLSPLLVSWDENQVTWNRREGASTWTAGGGQDGTDFLLDPLGYGFLGLGATNQFTTVSPSGGIVQNVQSWINHPSQNFGWILTADNESDAGNEAQIDSREDAAYAPTLTVIYKLPFAPPLLTPLPPTNGNFNFAFTTDPFHGYIIQFNGDLSGTNWQTVLILDPRGFGLPDQTQLYFPLTDTNRFYRVITD